MLHLSCLSHGLAVQMDFTSSDCRLPPEITGCISTIHIGINVNRKRQTASACDSA